MEIFSITGKQPEMLALLLVNNHNLAGASNQSVFTWQATPLLVNIYSDTLQTFTNDHDFTIANDSTTGK